MIKYPRALVLLLIITIDTLVMSCELDQMHQGCRIINAQCSCGYGCIAEYRYINLDECRESLHGSRNDICYRKPCKHGGSCLQISQAPRFKCRCEGTGFYGTSCDKACPRPQDVYARGPFPYECVVI